MAGAKFVLHINHYRFYNDDGGEAAATPFGAEDAAVLVPNQADAQLHLRILLEETGGGSGNATDDYHLEYQVNGGPFVAITAISARIRTDPSSELADGFVTTNRAVDGLTDPAGAFQPGRQEEGDGTIANYQHFANRFTEHVFALDFVAVDNDDGDVLVLRPIVSTGVIFDDVAPTVTISKPAGPRIQRATGAWTGPAASGAGPGPVASAGTGPQAASTAKAVGPAGIGSVAARTAAQGAKMGPSSIGARLGPQAGARTGVRARATPSAIARPRATASRIGPSTTAEAIDKDRGEVS